jgi:hypothetical protein
MTRQYSDVSETDTTYENPETGAVLAQMWHGSDDTIFAVYQPIARTNAVPSNPYVGRTSGPSTGAHGRWPQSVEPRVWLGG